MLDPQEYLDTGAKILYEMLIRYMRTKEYVNIKPNDYEAGYVRFCEEMLNLVPRNLQGVLIEKLHIIDFHFGHLKYDIDTIFQTSKLSPKCSLNKIGQGLGE